MISVANHAPIRRRRLSHDTRTRTNVDLDIADTLSIDQPQIRIHVRVTGFST